MTRVLAALVVVGVLAGACADSEMADPLPADSTAVVEEPAPDASVERSVAAADDAPVLVAVAAEWQCDLQRFAFDSLSDLDELLAETLAARGVSVDEFEAFELELESDRDLREQVLAVYEADCLGG